MENKPRTIEDVQSEYSQACAKAGHLGYQIETLKKDLEKTYEVLMDLNLEAAKISAANKNKEVSNA